MRVIYRRLITIFVIGALFLLIGGTLTPSYSQDSQSTASVPYTTVDSVDYNGTNIGVPIISVDVIGHPAKFIFDTGTAPNIVSADFANRIGLVDDKTSGLIVDAAGNTLTTRTYDLIPIKIGSYTIKSNVLSAKNDKLSDSADNHIDGILGKIAFDNAAVLMSPTLKTLTFYIPGNLTRQQLVKIGMGSAIALPLKLKSNGLLSVSVTLKQKSTVLSEEMAIDTGSERTIVSENAFKSLKGDIVSKGTFASGLSTGNETNFTVEQIILGSLSVNNPVIAYTESKKIHLAPTLGRDILSQYQVLIDTPAMMMYLLPGTVPIPPQKDGSQISLDDSQTSETKDQPK